MNSANIKRLLGRPRHGIIIWSFSSFDWRLIQLLFVFQMKMVKKKKGCWSRRKSPMHVASRRCICWLSEWTGSWWFKIRWLNLICSNVNIILHPSSKPRRGLRSKENFLYGYQLCIHKPDDYALSVFQNPILPSLALTIKRGNVLILSFV